MFYNYGHNKRNQSTAFYLFGFLEKVYVLLPSLVWKSRLTRVFMFSQPTLLMKPENCWELWCQWSLYNETINMANTTFEKKLMKTLLRLAIKTPSLSLHTHTQSMCSYYKSILFRRLLSWVRVTWVWKYLERGGWFAPTSNHPYSVYYYIKNVLNLKVTYQLTLPNPFSQQLPVGQRHKLILFHWTRIRSNGWYILRLKSGNGDRRIQLWRVRSPHFTQQQNK